MIVLLYLFAKIAILFQSGKFLAFFLLFMYCKCVSNLMRKIWSFTNLFIHLYITNPNQARMRAIIELKIAADNVNFFFRTTAGRTFIILIMTLVEGAGTTAFFVKHFSQRVGEILSTTNALPISVFLGVLFSFVMNGGSYFMTLNGYHRAAKILFAFSLALSIGSYASVMLPSTQVPHTVLSFSTVTFVILILMVLTLGFVPSYVTKVISQNMSEDYKTDQYMIALKEGMYIAQKKIAERQLEKIGRVYEGKDEAAASRDAEAAVASLLRSVGNVRIN